METIDLTGRSNRLDELVWTLTGCAARDARRATHRPDGPVTDADAITTVATAMVRLRQKVSTPTPA